MNHKALDSAGVPEEYWFNLKTSRVEFGRLSAASYRVGPFNTRSDAEQALTLLAERAKKWNEESED